MPLVVFLLLSLLFVRGSSAQPSGIGQSVRESYQAGELAMQKGDLPLAVKHFQHVLDLVPNDVGARVNLGVACMRQQKWKEALHYLTDAEKLAPQVPGIRLNIGLVHYRQADYTAAIPEFQAVLKQQPDSPQARRLLGLCYLFNERYAEATTTLQPLWPASSGDISYLYSLAVAAGNSSNQPLEQRAIEQLIQVGNDSPVVHLLIGKAYLGHEEYENALQELQKAAAGDSKLPMLHYNLGMVYRHKGDLQRARSEFLQDASLEPNVPFNFDQLGALLALDGKDREALAYFSKAVQLDPKLGTSWFGLAKIYKQEKRYPEALKALSQAGSIDPDSASVHYLRAQVLAALNRKSEAQAEFAIVQRLKKQTTDKFERQVLGTRYVDPELRKQ